MAHHRRLTFLLSAPHTQSLQGFTLIEAMVTIAMVGVLAAIAAPNVTRLGSKPLPDTANQVAGVFRAARTRAMAQTSPIKVRPLGNVALAMVSLMADLILSWRYCGPLRPIQFVTLKLDGLQTEPSVRII